MKHILLFSSFKLLLKINLIPRLRLSNLIGKVSFDLSPYCFLIWALSIVLSCLYTSQQNGQVERKNRHVVEMGLSLLAHLGMPLSYWPYAFQTATYLINRLPTPMLHHQSPYFALYHKLPSYTHLKVFGSSCFPYLHPYNTHKLQYRSLECAFLGYSSHHKGYLCLDIHSSKVYISHHVIFNEDSFPFKNLSSSPSQTISSSSSSSVHLSIPLSPLSPSPPISPSIPHSFPSSFSTSSTCSPLVAPTSLLSSSHSMFPSIPTSFPPPPSVDLPIPCADTNLLTSSCTYNIHPMVTRSNAGIINLNCWWVFP